MITKIPKKLWRVSDGTELVYMTELGTDAAFKKRSATGISWAKHYHSDRSRNDNPVGIEFDNDPVNGFSFVDFSTRSTTDNKLIQIRDPRGFIVESPIKNIMDLLKNSTTINGDILGLCVWGREGNNHALLPIGSQLYRDVVDVNDNGIITVADLKPGDVFKFLSGSIEYIYWGMASVQYKVDIIKNECRGPFTKRVPPKVVATYEFDLKEVEHYAARNGSYRSYAERTTPTRKCVLVRTEPAVERKDEFISANPSNYVMKKFDNMGTYTDVTYDWKITHVDWKN